MNSNIEKVIGGNGKRYNPYRINGDKKTGNTGELINTRLSGEYVKVDNKVYRIVGIENNKTKLTSVDYAKSGNQNLSKSFGSNTRWGTSVSSGSDDYWGYYLNNTWITTELQKYITTGTYYLGQVSVSSSYKNSICSNSNTTEPIISCTKTTSTWTGKVGLPRVGEMFSAQLGKGRSNGASYMWLITPYSSSTVVKITDYGSFNSNITSGQFVVRPSIYLKPEVIITGGDGMSETTAYTIGLES